MTAPGISALSACILVPVADHVTANRPQGAPGSRGRPDCSSAAKPRRRQDCNTAGAPAQDEEHSSCHVTSQVPPWQPLDLLGQSDRLELRRASVRCHTAASGSGAGANLLDQIGERALPACGVRGILDAHRGFARAGAYLSPIGLLTPSPRGRRGRLSCDQSRGRLPKQVCPGWPTDAGCDSVLCCD